MTIDRGTKKPVVAAKARAAAHSTPTTVPYDRRWKWGLNLSNETRTVPVPRRPFGRAVGSAPVVAFGAGPVSGLMQSNNFELQRATISAALEAGIDWFDVAPTYGDGACEANLGDRLRELGVADRVRVATKVRIAVDAPVGIAQQVESSVAASIKRLGVERIALLQVHNAITERAGTQAASIAPSHILESDGTLDAMARLRSQGLVQHLGLTGLGSTPALLRVLKSDQFVAVQTPYSLVNPSGGRRMNSGFGETDHGQLIEHCHQIGVGVYAIRVFAGGALAGKPPSAHTMKTKFFPLDLYQRDCERAARIRQMLPPGLSLEEAALRFSIGHPGIAGAIVGFGSPTEVANAVAWACAGPLPQSFLVAVERTWESEH